MSPFIFDLPPELIAQTPAQPRDSARLLVFDRATKEITHTVFSDIGTYLAQETTIVVNSSKVEHCRYLFDNDKTEIFVLDSLKDDKVLAMVRPGRKFALGQTVQLSSGLSAVVENINVDGHRTLALSRPIADPKWAEFAHVPLPPYITQNDSLADDYQTVYAQDGGSKAAPTAGLHFTEELLAEIARIHQLASVNLDVGLGTFARLTPDQINTKTLHYEDYFVTKDNQRILNSSKHITAVGTTTVRTLESMKLHGPSGQTNIFIQPGYEFTQVDSMVTNFHLPSTSLLMMVEAFLGSRADLETIYQTAIKEKYRFYSFGDAMLIL